MQSTKCSIENCERSAHARGWCSRHYGLWRHKGDPRASSERHYASPSEAMDARTVRSGECLIWNGYRTEHGYGMLSVNGKLEMAHRFAWIRAYGAIPERAEVDHTCWNRACCEPKHLRLATHSENGRNRNGAMVTSRTGVRNVSLENGRYKVVVNRKHVGMFDSMADAVVAAEGERNAQFGEFAGRG